MKLTILFLLSFSLGIFSQIPEQTEVLEKCCRYDPQYGSCACRAFRGYCLHCDDLDKPITNPCPHGCGPGQPQPPP